MTLQRRKIFLWMTNYSVTPILKDTKNLVDFITQETDVNDILFDHVPIDTTPNVPPPPDPLINFPDILLPEKQRKKYRCKRKLAKNTKKLDKKRTRQKN